jgi:hypothetical protein
MKKAGFIISIVAVSLAGLFIFFPAGAYFATIIGAPLVALSVDRGAVMGWIAGGLNIANILFFSPSVWIATGLTLSDVDSTNMTAATVSITANFATGQDVLAFTNTANITGLYNATCGVLTLSGTDTVANYQAALRSIT